MSDFVIENGVLKKYNGPGGDVTVPEGVTKIRDFAFRGCTGLTSVSLPDSVTEIGDSAFWGCTGLGSVSLPEHLADAAGSFDENVEVTVRGKPC